MFWEFIKILELIIIGFDRDVKVKGLLAFIVIFLYGVASLKLAPYQSKRLNLLDFECAIVCALSIMIAILINDN